MKKTLGVWIAAAAAALALVATSVLSGQVQMCVPGGTAPACQGVRGDRSEGWLAQTRSEVMARNGMVTTVQPLASQAGLRNSSRAATPSTPRLPPRPCSTSRNRLKLFFVRSIPRSPCGCLLPRLIPNRALNLLDEA